MKRCLVAFGICAALAQTCVAAVQVDLLVAFDKTSQAWLEADGRTPEAFAAEQVEKANLVLKNSGLSSAFSFRLAGAFAGEFAHDQSYGVSLSLQKAMDGTDPDWATLHTQREAVGADIVMVLVDRNATSGMAGCSNSMEPKIAAAGEEPVRQWGLSFDGADEWLAWFANRAYGVCDISAAAADYTFVHEVGHVMGAGHSDRLDPSYSEPGPQLFKYSSGLMYEGSDGNFYATVMGYGSTGAAGSPSYDVIPYFSSPDVLNPATGEPLGDEDHDNVSTLRATCAKVAAFRSAVVPEPDPDPDPDPVTPTPDPDPDPDPVVPPSPGPAPYDPIPPVAFTEKKMNVSCAVSGNEGIVGTLTFTVAQTKNGISKVSAVVVGLDGKKAKAKAAKCKVFATDNGTAAVEFEAAVKGYDGMLRAVIYADGSISDSELGRLSVDQAEVGTIAGDSLGFSIDEKIKSINGGEVLQAVEYGDDELGVLPYEANPEPLSVVGAKWAVSAKPGKIKLKRDRMTGELALLVDMGNDGSKTNLSALKLNYAAKTGTFKGGFTAYALGMDGTKLLKYKFTVTGVVVNGVGIGVAECKKTGTKVGVSIR